MTIASTPEHERSTGARPAGVTTEQAAAANVQQMFDTIAPTYDRANHLLSAGIDHSWWTRTARLFHPVLEHPETVALDLCCGTGDMTMALLKHRPRSSSNLARSVILSEGAAAVEEPVLSLSKEPAFVPTHKPIAPAAAVEGPAPKRSVILSEDGAPAAAVEGPAPKRSVILSEDGASAAAVEGPAFVPTHQAIAPILAIDFSHQMLSLGQKKFANQNILPIEADALHLPIASNSIDLVTSAFGFRNLANYQEGLTEILRVLRPGGQLGILDCNQPEGLTGAIYNIYFKSILPRLGGLITGNQHAYSYLNSSVERFPRPPRMIELLRNAGFANPTWTSYTFGVVGLYHATKSPPPR